MAYGDPMTGAQESRDFAASTLANVVVVTVPAMFFEDHVARELMEDDFEVIDGWQTSGGKWRARVRVSLTERDRMDLLLDARYYADPYGPDNSMGLKASARATVRALEA